MTKLPESFISSMKDLLLSEFEDFCRTYEDKGYFGLRVNTRKISCDRFEAIAPFHVEKIPFISNGYYINEDDEWSKHPYYFAGLYYLQEPSAMLVAKMLPVGEEDLVLDLCAAPGGKSTAISSGNVGFLLSNDISFSRTMPLVKNLELFGGDNYCVTCTDPGTLAEIYPETFSRIIVDAPCSGEGMFRKDDSLIKAYMQKGPELYKDIQEEILENAYRMLKCGGYILYSTCTFSDTEDEQVILSFINRHNDIKVSPIDRSFGLSGQYEKYKDYPELDGIVHAFPHKIKGEGHFLALLKKDESDRPLYHDSIEKCGILGFEDLDPAVRDLIGLLDKVAFDRLSKRRFLTSKDGFIYMLPETQSGLYDNRLRYVRTGTCIGSIKKNGRFCPHTAFALILGKNDFTNCVSFDPVDPCVMRYLRGETITSDDLAVQIPEKGVVLVCVSGFSLGWARFDGKKLKNMYEKGWMIR